MKRNLAIAPASRIGLTGLGHLLRKLREDFRLRRDAVRLDQMPRDRLEDMGIAPRTEANYRHSGESGPLPSTNTLW